MVCHPLEAPRRRQTTKIDRLPHGAIKASDYLSQADSQLQLILTFRSQSYIGNTTKGTPPQFSFPGLTAPWRSRLSFRKKPGQACPGGPELGSFRQERLTRTSQLRSGLTV
jgi:hypothetical protein